MNIPELFYKMAELTPETLLADLMSEARVKIREQWYSIGERNGSIVFLDSSGRDYSFSDLSVITAVEWRSPKVESLISSTEKPSQETKMDPATFAALFKGNKS